MLPAGRSGHADRGLAAPLEGRGWLRLLYLAHVDKARAFEEYAAYYLTTTGQIYWSDTQQLGFYADDYHLGIDLKTGTAVPTTEMISEVYVPRQELAGFLAEAAEAFRELGANDGRPGLPRPGRMADFLAKKLEHDPGERFQSEWYRHYRAMYRTRAR